MTLAYPDVAALLQIHPTWIGFEDCLFELRILPLAEALDQLRACWGHDGAPPGSMTFDAHRIATSGPNEQVRVLAGQFWFGAPVFAVAFSRNILNARWSAAYPAPGPELVVIDGNHRLAALAHRRATGQQDQTVVGVFVCE